MISEHPLGNVDYYFMTVTHDISK